MLIDHIGIFLFANNPVFRGIGRLSFPLFVFLLADGVKRSHNIQKYANRLLLLWVISIIPYSLAFFNQFFAVNQNIFLSLYIYLCLYCLLSNKNISLFNKYILNVFIAFLSECFHLSYGWYGVALAILMFQYKQKNITQNDAMYALLSLGTIYGVLNGSLLPVFAGFSFLFLSPNGELTGSKKPDKISSIMIYAFYPVHLILFLSMF